MRPDTLELRQKIHKYKMEMIWAGHSGIDKKTVMAKFGITSENQYRYLVKSDEAIQRELERGKQAKKAKDYFRSMGQMWPKLRKTATPKIIKPPYPYPRLKENIKHFQKKSSCLQPFTCEGVIDKFGQNPRCYLTGRQIDYANTKTYNLDHLIAIRKGGSSDLSNLALCHPVANRMKGSLPVSEFVRYCKEIAQHFEPITCLEQNAVFLGYLQKY